ncbi:hypothetical protein FC83_GL003022 [Agrilactobacillus composti DSM 18527 = JCM 14202]|uniref:Xylose isomerase-like TIM barrel domain-containing protein n=1 Tax=Agrilactobacillus composti DSM 18527 = JCM 14202 TaxID=1423734 RepID=X0PQK5_9LACO|nr:hypothetical protein [Agrilactobacillus composti]KRM36269.1 hypothetical protein FC83_GL003022 [Agrilactobacillus composti DSM 18527 = JCM 14202]GAF40012.1 hypothetical protein JCM14202_1896 [Agrilactobacillus composti DSM 18527 = JCM 14202]
MNVAVNTAVFLKDLQAGVPQIDCLRRLQQLALPIPAVEVRGEFFDPQQQASELAQIAQLCQQADWELYYSVPEALFTSEGVAASLSENLQLAQKYQIRSLKYSFGNLPDLTPATIADLRALLTQSGVQVTIENQPNAHGTLRQMQQDLAWVRQHQLPLGYTFDAGNWYWVAEHPEVSFGQLQDQVTVFHLKDIKHQDTVLLDQGCTDWRNLVNQLPETVPVFLEYAVDQGQLADQIKLVNAALSR